MRILDTRVNVGHIKKLNNCKVHIDKTEGLIWWLMKSCYWSKRGSFHSRHKNKRCPGSYLETCIIPELFVDLISVYLNLTLLSIVKIRNIYLHHLWQTSSALNHSVPYHLCYHILIHSFLVDHLCLFTQILTLCFRIYIIQYYRQFPSMKKRRIHKLKFKYT